MTGHHGNFIWHELMTTDVEAATRFYGSVVDWSSRPFGEAAPEYQLFGAPDGDVAGVMALPSAVGARPGWLGYISVDDVEAAVATVEAAGGRVHMPPRDLEGVGRFALLGDPQGVAFYVMRAIGEGGAPSSMAVGHCGWNELSTGDPAGALDFYGHLFGWTPGDAMPMGDMGEYRFLQHGEAMIGAVMPRQSEAPPAWHFYFRVASIDAAVERIGAGGGSILWGPMEVPGGDHAVNAVDPQGAAFGLVGPR